MNTCPKPPLRDLLLAMTVVSTLIASAATGGESVSGAKKRYQEGFRLFEERAYPAALAAFEESYELHPNPDVLYNIAMCQESLFLYVEAIDSLTKYLTAKGDSMQKKKIRDIIADIEQLEIRVAKIVVAGAPDGGDVSVDGVSVAQSPVDEPLSVNPGTHVLEVNVEGYEPFKTSVKVSSGETVTVNAPLKQTEARLRVDCWAAESVVSVDNREVGRCPYEGGLMPGLHVVRVDAPYRQPFETQIDTLGGGTATVVVPQKAMPLLSGDTTDGKDSSLKGEGSAPTTSNRDGAAAGMQITGWLMVGTGLAVSAVGAVFTYRYVDHSNTAEAALDRYNKAEEGEQDPADKETYNTAKDRLPADRAGIIIGYTSAGVLITAGVILAVLGAKKAQKPKKDAAVRATPGGVTVSF